MWHFWGLSAIEVHYVQGYHLSLLIDVKKMKKNLLHFMQIISRNCSWHDTKLHHVAASHQLRLKRKLSPNSSRNMLIPCALFQLMDIYFSEGGEVGAGGGCSCGGGGGMKERCHITCTCLYASSLVAVISPDRSISVHGWSGRVPQPDRMNRQRGNPDWQLLR